MVIHNLKLFIRSFRANLIINLLNILGLAAGLAACMMIIIYISNEFSYERHHEKADRIMRVNTYLKVAEGQEMRLPSASYPVSEGLAREISGIENFVRFRFSSSERPVYVEDRVFYEGHVAWVDSTVFDIFSFPLVQGDPERALAEPLSAVLARSTAEKFFGDENPVGRRLSFDGVKEYTVTGIMEDIPQPSHMHSFPMLMSLSSLTIGGPDYWVGRANYGSYVLLAEGQTAEMVQPSVDKVFAERASTIMEALGAESTVSLQPIRDIHFDTSFDFDFDDTPAVTYRKVTVFAVLAGFILVIATVSFINLATARSAQRAHQVGISKAIGAPREALVRQFLGEFILISLLALAVAFSLVDIFLPFFNDFVGRDLATDYISNPKLPLLFTALALATGVLAGIYPALFLSSFKPMETIRASLFKGPRRTQMRPVLITFQFTISILLVICTLTVVRQLRYMDNRDPGYEKDQLLVLNIPPGMTESDCRVFRDEALKHPSILRGTLSNYLPTMGHMEYTYDVPDPVNCEMLMSRQLIVDEDFLETMGIELVEGRNFERGTEETIGRDVIINETAARTLGYDEPIGRLLDADPEKGEGNYDPVTIIGVVRDINFQSFHHAIEPMVLARASRPPARISLRLSPSGIPGAIDHVTSLWKEQFPDSPLRYNFLDDNFDRMYSSEIRLQKLFTFYTILAVVISCMGLLALISYSAERRKKEVSIRKVLGASVNSLFLLLSREYLVLVLLANLISWPIAAFAMRRWMQNFAYQAGLGWYLYPIAGLAALALAVLTAASLTIRICRANPADTLRQE